MVAGIELARNICDATVNGLSIGSTEIDFSPFQLKSGEYTADTKTAGFDYTLKYDYNQNIYFFSLIIELDAA